MSSFSERTRILGIETSCDETALAIVEDGVCVISCVIATSVEKHAHTGGIVPEVAARDALEKILPALIKTMAAVNHDWKTIDAIAVTEGPGLMGSLLVGIEAARALAFVHQKPLVPVPHILGHICANRLEHTEKIAFPALVLTVSGGHNELVLWNNDYSFQWLGGTIDDAAGEAFDKGARILGLGFPGGPEISKWAEKGNRNAFSFPRPMRQKKNYCWSFSGLKTALLYESQKYKQMTDALRADLAASYEEAICDSLLIKLQRGIREYSPREIHLSGGVSANRRLREKIQNTISLPFRFPKHFSFCTDNAAMIAGAAFWKIKKFSEKKWDWREVKPVLEKKWEG